MINVIGRPLGQESQMTVIHLCLEGGMCKGEDSEEKGDDERVGVHFRYLYCARSWRKERDDFAGGGDFAFAVFDVESCCHEERVNVVDQSQIRSVRRGEVEPVDTCTEMQRKWVVEKRERKGGRTDGWSDAL